MTKNFASGILSLLIGIIYLVTALRIPDVAAGDNTGPRLFPILISIAAITAGALLCFSDRRYGSSGPVGMRWVEDRAVWIKIFIIMALGVTYGLVLDTWGYLLATGTFMLCATMLINRGRYVQNLLLAFLFPAVTYGAFALALKLSLPRGILENLLPF